MAPWLLSALSAGVLLASLAGCRTRPLDSISNVDMGGVDLASSAAGPIWPQFQRDRAHSGRSPAIGPATPRLLWTFVADNPSGIEVSPSVGADRTLYAAFGDHLYAIDASGHKKWSLAKPANGIDGFSGSPALADDGTIYVGSADHNLYAVTPDGKIKWSFAASDLVGIPTVGSDGTIYVGSFDQRLYALSPDGTARWSFASDDELLSAPAVDAAGTIYIGSWRNYSNPSVQHDHLYALSPDGALAWSFQAGGVIYAPTVGGDSTVYFRAGDARVDALGAGGDMKWSAAVDIYSSGAAAIGADGTLYVGYGQNQLAALRPDGSLAWTFAQNDICSRCSPVVGGDGTIYMSSFGNRVYAVRPDGSERWAFTLGATSTHTASAVSAIIGDDGTLYVGADDNQLYAIGQ